MQILRDVLSGGDKPEVENIHGARVRKMSPRRRHPEAQVLLGGLLRVWARGRGKVGSEWRFHVSGVKDRRDSYVPDIAYVSNERLERLTPDEREEPPFAPDVAVEIFSPGDREAHLAKKIERYLACGATFVLDVRPLDRTIVAHAATGVRSFTNGDEFEHEAVPNLRFSLAADLFDEIDPP